MNSIEIINCEQGTPEWHQSRAGVITASMYGEILKVVGGLNGQQQIYVDALLSGKSEIDATVMAGYKSKPRKTDKVVLALDGEQVGDFSETAKGYAFRVAIERISGKPLDEGGMETWAMRRGHELEPDARSLHAFMYDLNVEEAGFVRTSDGKFGASADGLIDEDGGSEYKCFIEPTKLRTIILERDISDYIPQCDGGLWLTERKWWDFCLYCPALTAAGKELTRFRIMRNEERIERMESRLIEFDGLVESFRAELLKDELSAEREAA